MLSLGEGVPSIFICMWEHHPQPISTSAAHHGKPDCGLPGLHKLPKRVRISCIKTKKHKGGYVYDIPLQEPECSLHLSKPKLATSFCRWGWGCTFCVFFRSGDSLNLESQHVRAKGKLHHPILLIIFKERQLGEKYYGITILCMLQFSKGLFLRLGQNVGKGTTVPSFIPTCGITSGVPGSCEFLVLKLIQGLLHEQSPDILNPSIADG